VLITLALHLRLLFLLRPAETAATTSACIGLPVDWQVLSAAQSTFF